MSVYSEASERVRFGVGFLRYNIDMGRTASVLGNDEAGAGNVPCSELLLNNRGRVHKY